MGDHFEAAPTATRAVCVAVFGLACLSLVACGADEASGRMSLHDAFVRAPTLEIQAPKGPLLTRAERLAVTLSEELEKEVTARAPDAGAHPDAVRIVVGTIDEPRIQALAAALGVAAIGAEGGGGFTLLEREYREPSDALVATFEDPERPGRPIVLVAGVAATPLAARLDDLPAPWLPRLVTWSAGLSAVDVELGPSGEPLLETLVDRARIRDDRWANPMQTDFEGFHLLLAHDADPERSLYFGHAAQAAVNRVRAWLRADELEIESIAVHVHGHVQDFERELGFGALGHVDRASLRVDVLVAEGVPHDGGASVARAVALALRGAAAEAWLEDGLAVLAADTWWGRPLGSWLWFLSDGLRVFERAGAGAEAANHASEHVRLPFRAQRVRAALDAGADLVAVWRGEARYDVADVPGVEQPGDAQAIRSEQVERRRRALSEVRRGVALFGTYADPGFETRALHASLIGAQRLGADAFSVTVHAAAEAPRDRLLRGHVPSALASDVALASAISAGRALDMSALLVIEPLLAPWGTWEDSGLFAPEETIVEFFVRVRRIVTHYALLAELCYVDTLCLGAGFDKSARTKLTGDELEPGRRAKAIGAREWSELIAHVRAAFGGALTAANRGVLEAKRVGHWDQLDLVGVHVFDPLTDTDGAELDDALVMRALDLQFERARAIGSQWQKPVVVLQIGFPATASSWCDPSVPQGPDDPAAQERFYRLLASWMESAAPERLPLGLYIWSWDPRDPRLGSSVYSPRGRPAQVHLETIFARR